MAKLWKPVVSYERGRQFLLFLFCLFLAFIIWTLHKLSEDQSVYLQYNVHIKTNLAGRDSESLSKEVLVLKGEATGFYVIGQKYSSKPAELLLEVNSRLLKRSEKSDELFYLKTSDISALINDALEGNVKNITLFTDTLKFSFPRRSTKTVPVVAVVNGKPIHKNNNYGLVVTPEFITISGSYGITSKIDSVYTENIMFSVNGSEKNGVIKLRSVNGIKYSEQEVYYFFDKTKQ